MRSSQNARVRVQTGSKRKDKSMTQKAGRKQERNTTNEGSEHTRLPKRENNNINDRKVSEHTYGSE